MIDASVVMDALVHRGPVSLRARERMGTALRLHAPHLIDLEILSGIRRAVARGAVSPERAELAVANADGLALRRHSHRPLRARIWSLRHNLTAYDAAYVALAEALEMPLVTGDARLAEAPGIRCEVEVIA